MAKLGRSMVVDMLERAGEVGATTEEECTVPEGKGVVGH